MQGHIKFVNLKLFSWIKAKVLSIKLRLNSRPLALIKYSNCTIRNLNNRITDAINISRKGNK